MLTHLRTAILVLAIWPAAPAKDKVIIYHGGAIDARDHGYQHGYREGLRKGIGDRTHKDKYKPEVKDADAGYEKYMGNKDQYKAGYRNGFIAGYDDGFYNRASRLGQVYGPVGDPYSRSRGSADRYEDVYASRGWGASDVAYDIGYRDGLTAGSMDFRERRSARPEDQRDYRDAEHGYRPSYGDRELYRRQYRDGFVRGYEDGYRGLR